MLNKSPMVQQKKRVVQRRPKVRVMPRRLVKKEEKEVTRLGAALRGLGALGGSAVGSLFGAPSAGGGVGRQLGASLSKWLGSGDYELTTNSIVQSAKSRDSIPAMHRENQSIIIRHKEYLGEILGSTGFTVQQTYNINPGLGSTFPWLAAIAAKFQEYTLRGMVFHYAPTSGTAVGTSSTALGSVMIQTTYRAGDSAPTTKQEMLNEYWSSEMVPFEAGCHPIECDPRENPYNLHYVRTGALPAGSDQLLYDMGTTFVATSGMQTNNVVGDLWVTYEIELKKPMLVSGVTDPAAGFSMQIADSAGSITASTLFNGTQTLGNGTLAGAITLSGNVITIPQQLAGWFYVYVNTEATTTFSACNFTTGVAVTGCSLALGTRTTSVARTTIAGTAPTLTRFFYEFAVFKSDTSVAATATIPSGTLTGSAVATNVVIIQRSSPFWT